MERRSPVLPGLMQDWPLTTDRIVDHAARWHGDREIVSRLEDKSIVRTNWGALHVLAKRISAALLAHGVVEGDRVATLAMNGGAHLAVWNAISGIGAVCHTINPRLSEEQLIYIINHAADRIVFADGAFAPLLQKILPLCPTIESVVLLSPAGGDHVMLEAFIAQHAGDCAWGDFDETAAAGLCYTSGTTGSPKGVLYSHRSNFLHALMILQPDVFGLRQSDVIMPVVPMYHANAWGLTFAAPAVGAKLVLPGAALDGASLAALIESEGVTFAAGVPTVWLSALDHFEREKVRPRSLRQIIVGGAAMSDTIARRFDALGIEARHAWGMTEMSPVGGASALTAEIAALPFEQQLAWRRKQGRSPCGVELLLKGEGGTPVPHDGASMGALHIRGPAIAAGYYRQDADSIDADGFFNTGDIATIDPQGFMQITDRAKDIIKSGGEWISSIDIENAALSHPEIALAAVIGLPHPKWDERPALFITLKPGAEAGAEQVLAHLTGRIAKWWMPDRVIFLEQMPLGPTGKIDKKAIRSAYRDPS